jgi:hypothetical protein
MNLPSKSQNCPICSKIFYNSAINVVEGKFELIFCYSKHFAIRKSNKNTFYQSECRRSQQTT